MKDIRVILFCAISALAINACGKNVEIDKKADDAIRCMVLAENILAVAKANPNEFSSEIQNVENAFRAFVTIELKYTKEYQVSDTTKHEIEKKYFKSFAGKSLKEMPNIQECITEFNDDLMKILN